MSKAVKSVFDFNGLIPMSAFQSKEWQAVFSSLEKEQTDFLGNENFFRSAGYKWPRAPLYSFSRCYEYPYVYYRLKHWLTKNSGNRPPQIIDFGSGVTFFPFAVAKLGADVCCVDVDPVVDVDIPKAAKVISGSPGSVTAKVIDGNLLPYADNSVDGAYCISVLEHIPNFENTIREIWRVLRPGGILLLTYDIRLSGNLGLTISEKRILDGCLDEMFETVGENITIHPNDVLDAFHGPYPYFPNGWKFSLYKLKQIIKPLLAKTPSPWFNIAVECKTLYKKEFRG